MLPSFSMLKLLGILHTKGAAGATAAELKRRLRAGNAVRVYQLMAPFVAAEMIKRLEPTRHRPCNHRPACRYTLTKKGARYATRYACAALAKCPPLVALADF